jgi:hypothetical protein
MANTQSVLRAVAQGSSTPRELLAQVNEVLWAYIPPNMFVTCFCGILDPESGRLTYANAGHNSPLRQHEGKATDLRATGMPLDLMPGMYYEEKETVLLPGDGVLFYSAGLIEAHNPEREMLGSSRLKELVKEHTPGAKRLTRTRGRRVGTLHRRVVGTRGRHYSGDPTTSQGESAGLSQRAGAATAMGSILDEKARTRHRITSPGVEVRLVPGRSCAG